MAWDVMDLLAEWPQIIRTERGAMVRTSCVMPSGSLLSVSVQPAIDGWIVSDEGSAFWEAECGGRSAEPNIQGLQSRLSKKGLNVERGKIHSGRVSSAELPYMVAYLATATLDAAIWLSEKVKAIPKENITDSLPLLLRTKYPNLVLPEPLTLTGDTENSYIFKNVLLLPSRNRLILDPVLHQSGSIKSRVIANLDVGLANHDMLIQHIVYDDEDEWSQQELALLQVGAPVVALSSVRKVVDRLVA